MKIILFLVFMHGVTSTLAQIQADSGFHRKNILYQSADTSSAKIAIPGLRAKKTGRILFFAGLGLLAVGTVLVLNAADSESIGDHVMATVPLGPGFPMTSIGIALWTSGAKRHREYLRKNPDLQASRKGRK